MNVHAQQYWASRLEADADQLEQRRQAGLNQTAVNPKNYSKAFNTSVGAETLIGISWHFDNLWISTTEPTTFGKTANDQRGNQLIKTNPGKAS